MAVGEHIHWYITDKCNLRCGYCFKPKFKYRTNEKELFSLANLLAESDIKKVTIGGGEPTLIKKLDTIVKILKQGGKYVSLHTNGLLLDNDLIKKLEVDDIALPIDTINRNTQQELRGNKFLETFDRLPQLASVILDNGMKLGYHTVFTSINHQDIPATYDFIQQNEFNYWKVYEFNNDLALMTVLHSRGSREELATRIKKIEKLGGKGTPEKGFTDCLLAHFFLMEQQMEKHNDKKIQFITPIDTQTPYTFLDNRGNVSFYFWFSNQERVVAGNILRDGYQTIQNRLQEMNEKAQDWEFDEKTGEEVWWATVGNLPIWARLYDGDFFFEELEEIEPEFLDDVAALYELYVKRWKALFG